MSDNSNRVLRSYASTRNNDELENEMYDVNISNKPNVESQNRFKITKVSECEHTKIDTSNEGSTNSMFKSKNKNLTIKIEPSIINKNEHNKPRVSILTKKINRQNSLFFNDIDFLFDSKVMQNKWRRIRIKTFLFLERRNGKFSFFYHSIVITMIIVNLLLTTISTMSEINIDLIDFIIKILDITLLVLYIIEYVLRIWSFTAGARYKSLSSKLALLIKPFMLIDFLIIISLSILLTLSFYSVNGSLIHGIVLFLRFTRIMQILRIDRSNGAFKSIIKIMYNHRRELFISIYISFFITMVFSFIIYLIENKSINTRINNIPDAIYFAMVTFFTIGYGDITPTTLAGRILTIIVSFFGVVFAALPTGILGSGFALHVANNQRRKRLERRNVPASILIQRVWRLHIVECNINRNLLPSIQRNILNVNVPNEMKPSQNPQNNNQADISIDLKPSNSDFTLSSLINTKLISSRTIKKFAQRKLNNQFKPSVLKDEMSPQNNHRDYITENLSKPANLEQNINSIPGSLIKNGSPPLFKKSEDPAVLTSSPNFIHSNTVTGAVGKLATWKSAIKLTNQAKGNNLTQFKPITVMDKPNNTEIIAIRFIYLIKVMVAVKKFKLAIEPYDIRDVVEQCINGQTQVNSLIQTIQYRLNRIDDFLGISFNHDSLSPIQSKKRNSKTLEPHKSDNIFSRLERIEDKFNKLDIKIDSLLKKMNSPRS